LLLPCMTRQYKNNNSDKVFLSEKQGVNLLLACKVNKTKTDL